MYFRCPAVIRRLRGSAFARRSAEIVAERNSDRLIGRCSGPRPCSVDLPMSLPSRINLK